MMPGLGEKYAIAIETMSKPNAEYLTDEYFELDLPVAPAVMVGEDIINAIRDDRDDAGAYVIPDVALSGDTFIDDTPLAEVAAAASAPVVVAPATAAGLLGAAR